MHPKRLKGISVYLAPLLSQQELEEDWRRRLEASQARYETATGEYRRLLEEEAGKVPAKPDGPLARARKEQSEALQEYSRLLQVFSDLTMYGKVPREARHGEADDEGDVAIIDDDESVRDGTTTLLRSAGYRVFAFASAEQFLDCGAIAETDCLIVDIHLPGMNGLELQRRLAASGARVPIIFLTGSKDASTLRRAIEGGASDLFAKPADNGVLVAAVRTALNRRAVEDSA